MSTNPSDGMPPVPPMLDEAPSPALLPPPHAKKLNILLGIVGVIAAVMVAVGVAAYQGWITIPFLGGFGTQPPQLEDLANAAGDVDAGSFASAFRLAVQPRQEGTPVIAMFPMPPGIEDEEMAEVAMLRFQNMADLIPSDFELSLETETTYTKNDQTNVESRYKGSFMSGGLSLAGDVLFRQVGEDAYIQINTLPLPFFDIGVIKGEWVHFRTTTLNADIFSTTRLEARVWEPITGEDEDTDADALNVNALNEEMRILREELFAHDAFIITNRTRGTSSDGTGRAVWQIDATLDPAQVRLAIVAAVDRRPNDEKPRLLTDAVKAYVDRDVFVTWLQSVKDATRVRFEADAKHLLPLRQTFELRYTTVAQEKKEDPKEYVIAWEYTFTKAEGSVNISAPDQSIEVQKAIQRVMHRSDEAVRFEEQGDVINDITAALRQYHAEKGMYPETLGALIGYAPPNGFRRVARIPDDVFTQQPFEYAPSADGKDYELTYTMIMPEDEDVSFQRYVQGVNTATKEHVSREAYQEDDSDGDGLTNEEEATYRTNPRSRDSDGDGFSDANEIMNGHNPLQHAKTGKTVGPF